MRPTILVTGGTGTLGRHVVTRVRDGGRDVRVFSRHGRLPGDGVEYAVGDLVTGAGIAPAVDGIETIVHCAGGRKGDDRATANLARAATHAGVRHLVYISVIGADRIPQAGLIDRVMFGYFGSKRVAEQVVTGSGLPWTTLRAAQFYDLILTVVRQMARLPVVPIPSGVRFQPIDAAEVADRLVELALGPPSGLVPDVAGPRVYGVADLLRSYLRTQGKDRAMMPLWIPGQAARAVRAGANLNPERAVGRRTWEDFLAGRESAASDTAQERMAA